MAWPEGRAADVEVEKRWWFVGHNKPDETGAEAAAKLAAGINGRVHPRVQVGGARALRRCNGGRMATRIQWASRWHCGQSRGNPGGISGSAGAADGAGGMAAGGSAARASARQA